MPFMHRNRRELSIIATALIFCSVLLTPARAEYNPKLGRFMQRDPIETAMLASTALRSNADSAELILEMSAAAQFGDGLTFYLYQCSNPLLGIDPDGLWWRDVELCMTDLVAERVATQIEVVARAQLLAQMAMDVAREWTKRIFHEILTTAIYPPSLYGWAIYDVTSGFYALIQHGFSWGAVAGLAADLYGLKGVGSAARAVRETAVNVSHSIKGMWRAGDFAFAMKKIELEYRWQQAKRARPDWNGRYAGGAYGRMRARGIISHHMPAWDAWKKGGRPNMRGARQITEYSAPSIQMDPADHALTKSFRRGRVADQFRADQAKLIRQGRYKEAFLMDVADIRGQFGNKYDEAIGEAMVYLEDLMR
jgi:hypothetical protein